MKSLWDRYELPTLLLGMTLYALWLALTWCHASIPTWLLFLAGGYVTQWHFSLQHESIHAMRSWPARLRTAFVWPPLGLWMPYPIYKRSHSTHHINFYMTHPQRDTESFYHLQQDWPPANAAWHRLVMLNQTLWFRLVFGPFLRLWKLASKETSRVHGADHSHLPHWGTHLLSLAVVLGWVLWACDMPLWKYLVCFAWPGMSLGMLRTFTEHRWGTRPMERVAIVESNALFGVLFLYNNLHLVHHRQPTLPWYRIPAKWRETRAEMLQLNGNFYYRGYLEIARRFMFKPVFDPSHPHW